MAIASSIKKDGANILRGGAFKPRSSPYSFQGFLDYIQEENEPFRIRVSGETCGTYNIDEYGKLTLDFITDPNLSYNSEFNLELLSLGLIKKIKKQDAKIKYDFLYR